MAYKLDQLLLTNPLLMHKLQGICSQLDERHSQLPSTRCLCRLWIQLACCLDERKKCFTWLTLTARSGGKSLATAVLVLSNVTVMLSLCPIVYCVPQVKSSLMATDIPLHWQIIFVQGKCTFVTILKQGGP